MLDDHFQVAHKRHGECVMPPLLIPLAASTQF